MTRTADAKKPAGNPAMQFDRRELPDDDLPDFNAALLTPRLIEEKILLLSAGPGQQVNLGHHSGSRG